MYKIKFPFRNFFRKLAVLQFILFCLIAFVCSEVLALAGGIRNEPEESITSEYLSGNVVWQLEENNISGIFSNFNGRKSSFFKQTNDETLTASYVFELNNEGLKNFTREKTGDGAMLKNLTNEYGFILYGSRVYMYLPYGFAYGYTVCGENCKENYLHIQNKNKTLEISEQDYGESKKNNGYHIISSRS